MTPDQPVYPPVSVKDPLTPTRRYKRPTKYRENSEFAAMLHRMIVAHGRRVQDADPDDLAELIGLADVLDDTIRTTIAHMRGHQELSWRAIAEATGTTRQAAQQRWGR